MQQDAPTPNNPSSDAPVIHNFARGKLKFSRKHIAIVVVIFALLGGFLLWRSFALTPVVASIEAEKMSFPAGGVISKDRNSSSGQALKFTQNGKATATITLPSTANSVTLRAASSKCDNKWAGVTMRIDGKTTVQVKSVATAVWKDYTASVNLAKGSHRLEIEAANTAKQRRCARVIFADLVTFRGEAVSNPVPTINFSASPNPVTIGSASTLKWETTNATSCTASGAWSGTKTTNGSTSTGVLNANTTYTLTCKGSGGSANASVTATVAAAPANPNPPANGTGNGNGTLLLDATFDSNLSNYPTKYFRAGALTFINARQEKFRVTTADSLEGNEGHYRADILTKDIYKPGVPTCTTVTVQFPEGLATVPRDSWLQFAEAKTPRVDYQGWNMGVSSWYNGGANSFTIGFQGFAGNGKNPGSPAWVSPPMDNAIHNFSVCTNNAADNTGMIESIWMDGARQTFNQGAAKGKQSLGGFPIIKGASAYPLVINNYTGGSPVPVTLIHGAPLISTIGSDGKPPMPPGGWRSF